MARHAGFIWLAAAFLSACLSSGQIERPPFGGYSARVPSRTPALTHGRGPARHASAGFPDDRGAIITDYEGSEQLRKALGWGGVNLPGWAILKLFDRATPFEREIMEAYRGAELTIFTERDERGEREAVAYWLVHRGGPHLGGNVAGREGQLLWVVAPIEAYRVGGDYLTFIPAPIPLGPAARAVTYFRGIAPGSLRALVSRVRQLVPRRAAAGLARGCFAAGTLVATPAGPRPIEALRAGDLVLSRDEATGEPGRAAVAARFVRSGAELVEVTVAAGGRVETLRTTAEHPFRAGSRGWVAAGALSADDELATRAGERARVLRVRRTGRRATVYNVEVEGLHTYFVGELGVWVHNKPMRVRVTGKELTKMRNDFNDYWKPEFWKKQAEKYPHKYSKSDLAKMKRGKPPDGPDGFSLEVHHKIPLSEGGLNEFSNFRIMTRTEHRLGGNLKLNHPNMFKRGPKPKKRK